MRLDDAKTGGWPVSRDKFGSCPEGCPSGIRHVGGAKLNQALVRNVRTCRPDAKGEVSSGQNREDESTEAEHRDGAARNSDEGPVMGPERRGCVVQPRPRANRQREEPVDEVKPFKIPKREIWEAFKRVKANQGAAGVDGQTIADFEADLSNNLYKLWNRMSSGSYFPPPVRRVDIPKADGGTRPLGIPTVADRVAQDVARRYLEPHLEPVFHADSYGYRPGRSAIDAVRTARQRCWRYDWVLDIDVRSYFDSIDWELLLKAVRRHTDCPWVLLYIERWLKAPVQMEDGSVVPRSAGTPQGGVISPSWQICSCITRSTCGWRGAFLASRSSDMRTTSSVTAKAPRKCRRYGARWPIVLRPASWSCIHRRRRSSTARMQTGVEIFRTSRLTFSDSHSERERRFGKVTSTRTASCPLQVRKR